jgi:hypothetical protein
MLAQVEAAAAVDATTPVRPRRGLRADIEVGDERVALVLPDRRIELPSFTEPALRTVTAGPVTPAELAGGELDEAGAVVLVRRLLREGALVATV